MVKINLHLFDKKAFIRSIGNYHLIIFLIAVATIGVFYNLILEGVLFLIGFYFLLDLLEFGLKFKNHLFNFLLILLALFFTWIYFKPGFIFLLAVLVKTCIYQSRTRISSNFYHTYFVYFLVYTHLTLLISLWIFFYAYAILPFLPSMSLVYHVVIIFSCLLFINPLLKIVEYKFILLSNKYLDIEAANWPLSNLISPLHTLRQNALVYGLSSAIIVIVAGGLLFSGIGLTTSIKVVSNTKLSYYISPAFVPEDKTLYNYNSEVVIKQVSNSVYNNYNKRYLETYEELRTLPSLEFRSFDTALKEYFDGSIFSKAQGIINKQIALSGELQYFSDQLNIIFEEMNNIYANKNYGKTFPDKTKTIEVHLSSLLNKVNALYPLVESKLTTIRLEAFPIVSKKQGSFFDYSVNKVSEKTNFYKFKQAVISDSLNHGIIWKTRNEIKELINMAESSETVVEKVLLYNLALYQLSKEYVQFCDLNQCYKNIKKFSLHPEICNFAKSRTKCGQIFIENRNMLYCPNNGKIINKNIQKCP